MPAHTDRERETRVQALISQEFSYSACICGKMKEEKGRRRDVQWPLAASHKRTRRKLTSLRIFQRRARCSVLYARRI